MLTGLYRDSRVQSLCVGQPNLATQPVISISLNLTKKIEEEEEESVHYTKHQ